MREIVSDSNLVAHCGLYCGACGSYLRGKCPGCRENQRAGWCKVRSCCMENKFASCADCTEYPNPRDCKKFNNFMAKLYGLFLRSDRAACIEQLRRLGIQGHADDMSKQRRQTIRK